MTKKILSLLSLILVSLFVFSFAGCSSSEPQNETVPETTAAETTAHIPSKHIYIVCSDDTDNGNLALQGFNEGLISAGLTPGENVKITVGKSADKDKPDYKQQAKDAVAAKPDLIYAVGEKAAKACADATKEIPIIFANIADPIATKLLTSCEKPDKNVTGVSDFIPVYQQLEYAKTLYPKAKKISVIYGEKEETSILISSLIEMESKDLMLSFKSFPAKTEDDVEKAAKDAVKYCDLIYVAKDKVTSADFSEILKAAKEKKLPVFSSTADFVNKGALATSVHDYKNIGIQAANMAVIILEGLKTTNQMPVYYPDICRNIVNKNTAKTLGLEVGKENEYLTLVPATE